MDRISPFACVFLLCLAGAAGAVLIESGDGTGNTTAPSPDPGWSNVGERSLWAAVYLGDGWVLTAHHVGAGPVILDGVTYPYLPSLVTRIQNGDSSNADLLVFGLAPPHPPLPDLILASTAPSVGEAVILIGNGLVRGAATSWQPNSPFPPTIEGYEWGVTRAIRWGTNEITAPPMSANFNTTAISTDFDEGATPHESQAVNGDSGGALFVENAGSWELAGMLYAIDAYVGQPAFTSLYGNRTYSVDIAHYRDAILDVTSVPEPAGGILAGLALLQMLARRASQRA